MGETVAVERDQALDLSWLTVEVAAYIGLVVAALVARLLLLGLWPLAEEELAAALAALRAARGQSWRAASYSPLVFDLNLLLFALTRATDGTVRLFPALAGTALVGAPYFFRRRLGRVGALIAAALVAFSPLELYLSRAGDGAILALFCTVIALAALEYDRSRLLLVALAVGMLSAPLFYTLPIGIIVASFIMRLLRRSHPSFERLEQVLAGVSRDDLVMGGLVLALGATAATANLAGVGATVELAWRWFANLVPRVGAPAWWWTMANLVFYEPLTLALALVACGYAIWAPNATDWERAVALWFGWALLLGTIAGHRGALWLGQAWLPATILAARGVERLLAALGKEPRPGGRETVGVALALAALCFAWLELVAYQQTGQRIRLSLMIWGLGAGVVLLWGYGLWAGAKRALCVSVCALALFGGGVQLANASALAYRTVRDPREPLLMRTASADLRALEDLVARQASMGGGDRTTLRVVYDRDLDGVLGWTLRDYPQARASADPLAETDADVWITPALPQDAWPARLAGQRVALWETLDVGALTGMERLRWVVTRIPVGAPTRESVHVWLPINVVEASH